MKQLYLIDFDVKTLLSDDVIQTWLEYHVKSDERKLSDILEAMEVSSSSYAYARKNGFLKSSRIVEAITKHYGLSLDIDETLFKKLNDILNRSFTESYFVAADTLKIIQEELEAIESKVSNTPLFMLFSLAYLNSADLSTKQAYYKEKCEPKMIPLMDEVYPYLSDDLKYFYVISKIEYSFATSTTTNYKWCQSEFERLEHRVDDRLKPIGYYNQFTVYFMLKKNGLAYNYLKKCQEYTFRYYNEKRLNALRRNIPAIAYLNKEYEDAIRNASNELIFSTREKIHNNVYFKSYLQIIITANIQLGRYKEALEYAQMIFDYELTDTYIVGYLYKAFIYYKQANRKSYDEVYSYILKQVDEKLAKPEAKVLLELINKFYDEKNNGIKDFGKLLRPITVDVHNGFNRVCGLLVDEYETYLRSKGKYIDVMDM